MGIDYTILGERRLVVCRAHGTLSLQALLEYTRDLAADAAFDPAMDQLFDVRHADVSKLSPADMERMARGNMFASGTTRVFVVPAGLPFGLGRVFSSHIETEGQTITLVNTLAQALEVLGIDERDAHWLPDGTHRS